MLYNISFPIDKRISFLLSLQCNLKYVIMKQVNVFRATIEFERFSGVKSCRSMWKKISWTAPVFFDSSEEAYSYVKHFVDDVAPAVNIRVINWSVCSELRPDNFSDVDPTFLPF